MQSKSISKQQYWKEQIIAAERFPGSLRAFCSHKGISFNSLQYWRHKFIQAEQSSVNKLPSPFVAIEVAEPQGKASLPEAKWLAELILHLQAGLR